MALKRFDDDDSLISEINVTPFVDIVLVLLVIFMVTANFILHKGLKIELPKADSAESFTHHQNQELINISIDKRNAFFLNGKLSSVTQIQSHAEKLMLEEKKVLVILSVDKEAQYKSIIDVMDQLRSLGVVDFTFHLNHSPQLKKTQ
ncbi:MAG: biopolymer transporter ExbD [Silvanigrellaceae bacterium]|nr:biopolymer transporter ExbD [Silvanigrellaceae bacterium]